MTRSLVASVLVLFIAGCLSPPVEQDPVPPVHSLLSCRFEPCSEIVIPAETWAEEPFVAVDPTNASIIVAAAPSYPANATNVFRWPTVAFSSDAGASWNHSFPATTLAGSPESYNIASDVTLAFHPDGSVIMAGLVWKLDHVVPNVAYTATAPDLGVWRSVDGGRTFPSGVIVSRNLDEAGSSLGEVGTPNQRGESPVERYEDKGYLTIDPVDGRAHLFWNRLTQANTPIARPDVESKVLYSSSIDAGKTWTQPRTLSESALYGVVADAHDGVIVASARNGISGKFAVITSDDAGATWTAPHEIAPANTGNYQSIGVGVWPTIGGTSALLATVAGEGSSRVDLWQSDDAGATWSGPVAATPEQPTTKRHPTIALIPHTGAGFLTYYEGSDGDADALHVYAQRIDAGLLTGERLRLTNESNKPGQYLMDYMGAGAAVGGGYAVWDDWTGDAMRIRGAALRFD